MHNNTKFTRIYKVVLEKYDNCKCYHHWGRSRVSKKGGSTLQKKGDTTSHMVNLHAPNSPMYHLQYAYLNFY